jgi:glycosyltransferase involved in cell wall biosynthesis
VGWIPAHALCGLLLSEQMMHSEPLVSVVIPTIGRPSLADAVVSVLRQTYPHFEIVVRFDPVAPANAEQYLPSDPRIKIIHAASREEISLSRARALNDCEGSFVAYLDDDNRYLETKLERQVAAAVRALAAGASHVVVGCRVLAYDSHGGARVVPRDLKRANQPMADYLFRRRQIRPGQTAVGATMLLCDIGLARKLSLTTPSSLHEDWEWAIRADQELNTAFLMVPEVLSEYIGQPAGASASSRASWRVSDQWVIDHGDVLSPRCQADFLLCITFPLAVSQRDWRGALHVVARSVRSGFPGLPAWLFAILYVVLPSRARSLVAAAETRIHPWVVPGRERP